MKNPEELTNEERYFILRILREMPHQQHDCSDIYVGNVLLPQHISNKPWMPDEYRNVPQRAHEIQDWLCDYGFLINDNGLYRITRLGVEFLRINQHNYVI